MTVLKVTGTFFKSGIFFFKVARAFWKLLWESMGNSEFSVQSLGVVFSHSVMLK